MTKQALAKLTRPRLSGIVARERLFQALDAFRDNAAIWVSGPPGAGKTLLIASYLSSRNRPVVWYQFDSGDADPATLFYYLRETLPARRLSLPLLTAEYQADVAAFARRFFRAYFSALAPDTTVVIDGLPVLDELTALKTALLEAIQEIPERCSMVLISREGVPAEFARLHLNGSIGSLGWPQLQLTLAETRDVLSAIPGLPDGADVALHEQAGGWMAGLRLLLEHYRSTGRLALPAIPNRQEALFGFFAAEIFDRLPEEVRTVLLRTCLLPRVSIHAAERMTGNANAWRVLKELNERNLFVDALEGQPSLFQYHNLFRTFLRERARHSLGPSECIRLQRQAATLLIESGQFEHAIPLLAQAGDWAAAGRVILLESAQMLARGHSQTLTHWVKALPSWYVAATPRLLYCLGMAQIASDPDAARRAFERAYERFVSEANPLGQALAGAGIVQTYYLRFDHLLGLPKWVGVLSDLVSEGVVFPSPESELHVRSMLQVAMTYARPDHPGLADCAERVASLVSRGLEPNLTISSGALLLTYYDWFAPEKARLLMGYVEPLVASPTVTPFNRIWWLLAAGYHHRFQGDYARMSGAFMKAEQEARESGLRSSLILLLLVRVYEHIATGDGTAGMNELSKASALVTPGRRQEEYVIELFAAQLALLQRDASRAMEHAEKANRLAKETGHRFSDMESLGVLSIALCESGRAKEAIEAIRSARAIVTGVSAGKIEFHHLLIEAYAFLKTGHQEPCRDVLRRACAIGRDQGHLFGFVWFPAMMTALWSEALEAGIETSYVLGAIRTCHLLPVGPEAGQQWPWPVRVRVFDRLEIETQGKPLVSSRKAQKKPMELLGALVAKGPSGADRAFLAQDLWPDSEGDAAESALRMNLHRLRKLLGNEEAVVMQDGRIRLDERIVWVDAWAFENLCARLDHDSIDLETKGLEMLELYRGPAFGKEAALPWMLPARERWRSKFVTAVAKLGAFQEGRGRWKDAEKAYQQAVDADPLSEDMYRNLMSCHLREGRHAEAYAVYRRCRDMLSITLGVRPSAETEALKNRIATQVISGQAAS